MILIYDIQKGGHHFEYLDHLMNCIEDHYPDEGARFVFLVHQGYQKNRRKYERVFVDYVEKSIQHKIETAKSLTMRNLIEYKLISSKLKQHQSNHLFLMFLDSHFPLLLLVRRKFTVSGIFFHPFYREWLHKQGNLTIGYAYRKLAKRTQLLLLKGINCGTIFVPNDQAAVDFYKNKLKLNFFKYLPDPFLNVEADGTLNVRAHYSIPLDRKIILVVGKMGARKNVRLLLEALREMSEEERNNLSLIIAGTFRSSKLAMDITELVNFLNTQTNGQVIWENSFVSLSHLDALFSQADMVYAAYINFYTSSGMIGHAAKYRKPILVSRFGLMCELVERYQLGLSTNPTDVEQLKEKIIECINYKVSSTNADAYLSERSPGRFASCVINALIEA